MALLVSLLAFAAGGSLVVKRAPEASDCPDAASLTSMIARLTPKGPEPSDVAPPDADRFDVEFSRTAARYRVVVRARGSHAGVRALEDAGATCASLAEATALTIAVIVDPEGVKLAEPPADNPPEPPVKPAPPPATPEAPPPLVVAQPARSTPWSLAVAAGGGAAIGILREAAPIAFVSFEVRPLPFFTVDVGGAFVPTQRLALERGNIDVWLLSGTANGCVWPYAETIRVGGCAGIAAGSIRGEGRGYPVQSGASRPWVAGTASAAANGPLVGLLGWGARAGIVVPTHRESFGIDGVGVAYEAPPAGAIVVVGATMTIR